MGGKKKREKERGIVGWESFPLDDGPCPKRVKGHHGTARGLTSAALLPQIWRVITLQSDGLFKERFFIFKKVLITCGAGDNFF